MKVDADVCTLGLARQIADIEGIDYSAGEAGVEDCPNAVPFGSCKGTGCVCATANGHLKMWGCLPWSHFEFCFTHKSHCDLRNLHQESPR